MKSSPLIERIIDLAVDEDYGLGDPTTSLTIGPGQTGHAFLIVKEELVFCGGTLIEPILSRYSNDLGVELHAADGAVLSIGDVMASIRGQFAAILSAERVVLNFCSILVE